MRNSKSISLFLLDGNPTGIIKATMQNWIGISYRIPRNELETSKNKSLDMTKHLKQTGIYFLLGEDADENKIIYIGQAKVRKNGEGLLNRILEHKSNTNESYFEEWNEVICLTTQNDSFGPTEMNYLENRFTNIAKEVARYKVRNANEPNKGNITEEKESELEEFIEYSRMITGVLGYKVFEPIVVMNNSYTQNHEETKVFNYQGKRFTAKAIRTNEGFVVLKGSMINPVINKSADSTTFRLRDKYRNVISEDYLLKDDILFSSPSQAASFVGGTPFNGNLMWLTDDNKSPKDL